jgi:hypothetical protein
VRGGGLVACMGQKCMEGLIGKPEEGTSRKTNVDGRIILKCILNIQFGKLRT